jgi:hypothetical protein
MGRRNYEIPSVNPLGAFEPKGLDPLRARSLIPVGINQSVDCDDHAPRHEAARDCERGHEQGDIAIFEHCQNPSRNLGFITMISRLGSYAG